MFVGGLGGRIVDARPLLWSLVAAPVGGLGLVDVSLFDETTLQ